MGQIRKQTILSSIVIYIGFAIGFVNTYLFVKNGTFTTEQYGLTRLMNDMGQTFFSFASLGVLSYVYKFFPYYNERLGKKNDQLAISLAIALLGFSLLTIASIVFEPLIIRKFSERSRLLISYYYWILPYSLGILLFTLFEAYAWFLQRNVLANLLKEAALRLIQFVLIILFIAGVYKFDLFIKLFSFTYLLIALYLLSYLFQTAKIDISFSISKVTRRYYKKIISLMALIFSSQIINTLAQYVDSIIIASISTNGLQDVGIYTLASFIANTIQVPQRSIISATVPVLSASWKNKNLAEINRIYKRSSINLLLVSLIIFSLIWLNIDALFEISNINADYEQGKMVILVLGISKIIDAGTGVNSQIIGTSSAWRFEVMSGSILLFLLIPLNYFLVKSMGINGSALSNLISFAIYNGIRYGFIWRKFNMQPFNLKTAYSILTMGCIYITCYFLFKNMTGWGGMFVRSLTFGILSISFISIFDLTPDAKQLIHIVQSKLRQRKNL
jgi:O-antigen/teichoic acid export membrane protein